MGRDLGGIVSQVDTGGARVRGLHHHAFQQRAFEELIAPPNSPLGARSEKRPRATVVGACGVFAHLFVVAIERSPVVVMGSELTG